MFFAFHDSPARAGYAHLVIDANTGKILTAKNADALNHPASLTKMMTLYATFEALHDGRLNWEQRIVMSRRGAATIPLKLGVKAGKTLTVREAVMGMIVQSANDAAEAICDHLAGSGKSCGAFLTRKARAIGMSRTTFRNGSGLPDSRQVTTARDMATLGLALQRDFPREYALFSTKSFKFRGRTIRGHNRLMYRYKGMDGIKTGYTDASGFTIVTAVNHRGRRVVGVVLGGKTARSRDARMAALLDTAMPKATIGKGTRIAGISRARAAALALPEADIPVPMPPHRQENIQLAYAETSVASLIQAFEAQAGNGFQTGNQAHGDWAVQIAATNSRDSALTLLSRAQPAIASRFSHVTLHAPKVISGATTLYRARFTGFDAQSSARSACEELRASGYKCLVVKDDG